jgi:organic radical activating enzyme
MLTAEEIASAIPLHYHVVITGGEPTLYYLDELMLALPSDKHYVQLETSGQNDLKGDLYPDWITWSPKKNLDFRIPAKLEIMVDEVKFVVDADLEWLTVEAIWDHFARRYTTPYFVLMPEGCPPERGTIEKTLSWLNNLPKKMEPYFFYGDRLQYNLKIR